MGAVSSTAGAELNASDIDEIERDTNFTHKQILRLYQRFKSLDKSGSGILSAQDFLAIPELAINPLGARVIAAFDAKRNDQVNFKQFCHTLAIFRPEASDAQKTDLAFRMYDVRGEGKIPRRDLHAVLKRMVGDNIHDDQLWQLVDKVIFDSKRGREVSDEELEYVTREDFDWVGARLSVSRLLILRLRGRFGCACWSSLLRFFRKNGVVILRQCVLQIDARLRLVKREHVPTSAQIVDLHRRDLPYRWLRLINQSSLNADNTTILRTKRRKIECKTVVR